MTNQDEKLLYDRSQDIDWFKLRMIFRKSLPWILCILITTNLTAYLYLRWTKPLFVSESNLKLDIKSDTGILGLDAIDDEQSLTSISGEVELIKSRMFSDRVINTLNLGISYYSVGKILNDERYVFSPFTIDVIEGEIYDTPVYVNFQNDGRFTASLKKDNNETLKHFSPGDTVIVSGLQFSLVLQKELTPEIRNTPFYFIINSYDKLIEYLENNLTVEPVNLNAKTIKVSFKDYNPHKAKDLVNAIDTIYLNYSKEEKQRANHQKISFVDEQLQSTEDRLSQIEEYLESDSVGVQSITLETELSELNSRIRGLNVQISQLENENKELSFLLNRLNSRDTAWLPESIDNESLRNSLSQYNTEILKLKELQRIYNDRTQIVQSQKNLVSLQKQNLTQTLDLIIEKKQRLQSQLIFEKQNLIEKLKSLPSKSNEFNKTSRYYKMYEDVYLSLMQSKTQFQIAQAGITTDFKILSQASMPMEPVSPQKMIIYGLGMISGFLFSVFFVGVRYILHNLIISVDEIEANTKLPVIGSVPFYASERLKHSKLLVGEKPRSAISEALRAARTNLEFFLHNKESQILAVTSTVSGEGKTFFSVNFGGIISLSTKKVIIVDLDMRRPRVHQALGIENPNSGVSTILIGKHQIEDCIQITPMTNLHFMSAGPPPPNPSELLLKPAFDKLLSDLSERYDVVILDTPPVGLVTDGILALKKSDLQIYVLRSEFSKLHYMETLMRLNKLHKFKNLTVLLNSIQVSRQGYGYGEGYYQSETVNG